VPEYAASAAATSSNGEVSPGPPKAAESDSRAAGHQEDSKPAEDVPFPMELDAKELEMQRLMLEAFKYGSGRGADRERITRNYGKRKKAPAKSRKVPSANEEEGRDGETRDEEKAKGEDGEENAENGVTTATKRRKTGFSNKPSILSPALAEVLGESVMTRPEVVKRLHSYFKEHNLQNPNNKRQIIFDDKLREVFKCKATDYFKLNRLISMHVKAADEVLT